MRRLFHEPRPESATAAIAMFVLVRSRGLSLKEISGKMDTTLMSGGIIILITAGGGAFGAMLRTAGVLWNYHQNRVSVRRTPYGGKTILLCKSYAAGA
ncbi:MAG: hypothetical protein IIB56_09080 [Planctomycetes bacterium]|nr:hypothetical protein [Planctomycetota bacterium]MCH8120261.1 hypothetical protein [Planctomycetota bacterium]